MLLIGTLFDADPAVGIACGLAIFAEAIEHGLALVVFFDPGVEVLHINGDDLAQARDFGLERVNSGMEQGLQVMMIEGALFLPQPAITG